MSIALATLLRNIPVPQQYLVALACGEVVQRVRPARVPGSRSVRLVTGGALAAVAISLIGWSLHATHDVDLGHPDRLVTSGPYALSRNPMYVAWAALAVGAGLLRNSMWMLASVPIGAGFVHRDVLTEEHALATRYPEQFPQYASAVPRYASARQVAGLLDQRSDTHPLD
ncbi:MAG TPA: isoprenylcysteine carboxylmethyltransferase family protein [Terrimesophilobacter sp.]|nr:isoprenylcysteine carboxylmethyltransferase family protein [Terrimesophilobacter sp.]